MLRLAADTARKTIRASDAVARLGGDAFAILLRETTAAASETVIRKLQVAISDNVRVNGGAMTVSLGAVTCLEAPDTVDALLRSADELLYTAKREGKNRARHRVLASPASPALGGRDPVGHARVVFAFSSHNTDAQNLA